MESTGPHPQKPARPLRSQPSCCLRNAGRNPRIIQTQRKDLFIASSRSAQFLSPEPLGVLELTHPPRRAGDQEHR